MQLSINEIKRFEGKNHFLITLMYTYTYVVFKIDPYKTARGTNLSLLVTVIFFKNAGGFVSSPLVGSLCLLRTQIQNLNYTPVERASEAFGYS